MGVKEVLKKIAYGKRYSSETYIDYLRRIGVKIGEDCTILCPASRPGHTRTAKSSRDTDTAPRRYHYEYCSIEGVDEGGHKVRPYRGKERRQFLRCAEQSDAARLAGDAEYEAAAFQGEHHRVHARRGDLEEALHISFGGRAAMHR